jgi:hypothetical protein
MPDYSFCPGQMVDIWIGDDYLRLIKHFCPGQTWVVAAVLDVVSSSAGGSGKRIAHSMDWSWGHSGEPTGTSPPRWGL